MRIDLRIISEVEAKTQMVGTGRSEPNNSPELKEPYGRIKLSANPLNMLGQLVGEEFRQKCRQYFAMIFCLVICVMMLPMVLSDLTSKLLLKMIGLGG